MKKLRIAIAGLGNRGRLCFEALLMQHADEVEISALCDVNDVRLHASARRTNVDSAHCYNDFNAMLAAEKLDGVVVTTPDCFHEPMVIAALEAKVGVLVDKPLATSAAGCRRIIAASEKSGSPVMIGFNLRHHPVAVRLKQVIEQGMLGRIYLVEGEEFYSGGRTYLARWNGHTKYCGSLWIHKGSHDFDLMNWMLGFPEPVRVTAVGRKEVFTPDQLPFEPKPGVEPGPSCSKCAYASVCPDIHTYSDAEWGDEAQRCDGYVKDRCIYNTDTDIHDNGIAIVEYANGVKASFMECFATSRNERRYMLVGTRAAAEVSLEKYRIIISPRWSEETITIQIPNAQGGHGGADPGLVQSFIDNLAGRSTDVASVRQGLLASSIGEAAERSRRENRTVELSEL